MLTKEKGRSLWESEKTLCETICKICRSLRFLQAGSTSCSKGRYDDPKSLELLVTHPPEVFFLIMGTNSVKQLNKNLSALPPVEVARFSDL